MQKRALITTTFLLLLALAGVGWAAGAAPQFVGPLYDGPELDYQPAILRMLPGQQLMVVWERLNLPSLSGDFYVAFSSDEGQTWTAPAAILPSPLNQRHPALVQLAANSFALFYLVDETGSGAHRLHRATSPDAVTWTDQGALDLGWATPGEINPSVIREADGTLTMTYHRLSGPSYIAQSHDDGATWDKFQTQVSPANAQLPRLAKRESDGLYLVTYQVGSSNLDLYAKVSTDPYNWSGAQIPVSIDINTHDSQPIVLEDGTFLVAYAKTPVYYFDVFYRTSCDGETWGTEEQVTNDPTHYDTQPHPLLDGTPDHVILTWSHQESTTPYEDHDVWVDSNLAIQAVPDLSASVKAVSPAVVGPTGLLTYTLSLTNDSLGYGPTSAWLTDLIPADTAYDGGLWASNGQYGYDPEREVITWTGVLSSCSQVTLGFRVSTALNLVDGQVVTNTAWLTDDQGTEYTLIATATADILPPTSTILDPQAGQFLSGTTYLISGAASDTVSGVAAVAVSVDGEPWHLATGQEAWTWLWDGFGEGLHNLRSQAVDGLAHMEVPGPGITVTVDATPPQLAAFRPLSGAVDVPLTATVALTFSESIVTGTLAFSLAPDPGGWAVAWNAEGTAAMLSHTAFDAGQIYTFTVTQARDRALNPLSPAQWTFATQATEARQRIYLPLVLKGAPPK